MFNLDKICLFLDECVSSGGVELHSSGINIGIHGGISLQQDEVYLLDGGEVVVEPMDDASGHVLQQFRGYVHLLAYGSKDVGIAHRIVHVVALHGLAEVGAQAQVDGEVVAHQLFLGRYAVIGVKVEVL